MAESLALNFPPGSGPLGSGAAFDRLIVENFITAQAAPLDATRNADPGPGVMTKHSDTANAASIANEQMVLVDAAPAAADPGYYWTTNGTNGITRAAGVFLRLSLCTLTGNGIPVAGWSKSTTLSMANLPHGVAATNSILYAVWDGLAINIGTTSGSKPLSYALALSSLGAALIQGKNIIFAYPTDNTATLYPAVISGNTQALSGILDTLQALDISGVYQSDYALATDHNASVGASGTLASAADFVAVFAIAFETGVTKEIQIRRISDDEHWLIRLNQGTGEITLHLVTGGSAGAAVATVAYTQTNGATRYFIVRALGTSIQVFPQFGTTLTYAAASGNRTGTGLKFTHAVTKAVTYPFRRTLPVTALAPMRTFLAIGDSKTVGLNDIAVPPTGDTIGWQYRLRDLVTSLELREAPARIARTGYGVYYGFSGQTMLDTIDADLAALWLDPDYVLFNLGVNDIQYFTPFVQADFETAYGTLLDKINDRFPNAVIYCAYPWMASKTAEYTTVKGYINNVIATRSFATAGLDEYVVLEGGDNGATYLDDGVHPNNAGEDAISAAYKTLLSL